MEDLGLMPRIIKIMNDCHRNKESGLHDLDDSIKYQNSKYKISESMLVKKLDANGLKAKSVPVSRANSPYRGLQR